MPPNTSHFLQPCDDKVFANFKKDVLLELRDDGIFNSDTKTLIGDYLLDISQKIVTSITQKVIILGIYRWTPDVILKNAKLNCPPKPTAKDTVLQSIKGNLVGWNNEKLQKPKGRKIKARVRKDTVYTADDLVKMSEEKANKEQKEKETKEKDK